MHLFNVKQFFFRRRKYERVLGGGLPADQQGLDLVVASASASTHKHHLPSNPLSSSPAQDTSSKQAMSKGSSSSASSTRTLWGFKMRPKVRMRKQKSLKLVSTSADGPSQAAVQNFLQGPSQDEEIYNQQCRDLLRKLSARGNRVPGFV